MEETTPTAPDAPAPELTTRKPGIIRRIIDFPLVLIVIASVIIITIVTGLSVVFTQVLGWVTGPGSLLGGFLIAVAMVLFWKGYKRWLEREPDREMAFAGAAKELGAGLACGFLLFSVMTGIVALLGGFEVLGVRNPVDTAIWYVGGLAFISGTFEEVLFRGVLFRQIERLGGSWTALLVTSVIFGAAHIQNPDASWFAAIAIMVEAGILLGAAYMLTRRLWLAIGIHAAWNFTQGWLYSIPVSGGDAPIGLLITRRVGPDWLTGGDFGLEASVVAMVCATCAGLTLLTLAIRREELRGAWYWRKGQ
ncbi:CPBP family intramembrane glutamic endopeptidase [Croceicoccus mobilis]|uniref:CAAX amino protease n=1 Tax=Croceicoccus mobilis TaxID=1703339 RepID=A0A916YYT7_9SPHN|nr:type II CAAX endopeptidase family protein [Croceicoccus mobilis]GGD67781.1 CAAX amino protease [Croceicoccus mobilis]